MKEKDSVLHQARQCEIIEIDAPYPKGILIKFLDNGKMKWVNKAEIRPA